jgi:hypothetical protein
VISPYHWELFPGAARPRDFPGSAEGFWVNLDERGVRPLQKEVPGVYFLLSGYRVVYVGQSVNVHARVRPHFTRFRNEFFRPTSACYIPIEDKNTLIECEDAFIRYFQPPLNGVQYGRHQRPNPKFAARDRRWLSELVPEIAA